MKLVEAIWDFLRLESNFLDSDGSKFSEEEFVDKLKYCGHITSIAAPLANSISKDSNLLFLVIYYNKLITSEKLTNEQKKRVKTLLYKAEDDLFKTCDSKYYKKNAKSKFDESLDQNNQDEQQPDYSTGSETNPTNSVRSIIGLT